MLSRRTSARPRTSGAGRAAPRTRQATATAAPSPGERPVRAAVAVPGLQGHGEQYRRAEHDRGARAQHPRRGGRGATVVGVVDEADHRGAHRGHRGGERQVAEYPLHAGRPVRPGEPLPGEVEVRPPGAEADHDGDQPDGQGEPADRPAGQPGDDTGERLAEHDDDEGPEPFGERVGDDHPGRLRQVGRDENGREPGQVGDVDHAPGRHPGAGRQQSRGGQQDGAGRRPGDEQPARPAVLGAVAARGQQPQHGQHREQYRRGDGERRPARPACLRDGRAHRGQHQDLQQERAAGAGVLVAVQLMVEAAVGPGDPHQREHDGELAEPGPGQVPGQAVCGLGDQDDHGQVVEQFERTDHTLARLLAVRTRRLPQGAAQPSPALPASSRAGTGRRRA